MDKEINNNGYTYVDLKLPSGTLWATCNVGASKPSDCGLYFQWGDTKGYTAKQVETDKQFTWEDYKFNPSGDGKTFTKYTMEGTKLDLEDDAAHVNMGGDWHIPNLYQIGELIEYTTTSWTTLDGIEGMTFTSKKDASKHIFIPAAGGILNGLVYYIGSIGEIWSSMLTTNDIRNSKGLYLCLGGSYIDDYYRYYGRPVRGVIDGKQDKNGNMTNKKMEDKQKLVKAYENEIKTLQDKIKDIQKKKNACLTDDYSKMYVGKYVKITRKELPYITECIYVRSVYTDMDSNKIALTLQGQGFCYSAGDYLDEIEGNFSETYSKTIYENWINDGTTKVDIISKDEYKKEVNKMANFILSDFDDVETIE